MSDQISFVATVRIVTFHNEDNGFCVLRVNKQDEPDEDIVVTASLTKPFPGATYEFTGYWTNSAQWGWQFKSTTAHEVIPSTSEAIEAYLGSGLISGIGPGLAARIVDKFGDKTFEVIEKTPDQLTQIRGITTRKVDGIKKSFEEYKHVQSIMGLLKDAEVSTVLALKIYKTYKDKAIEIIKYNPYNLAKDIYGIGFLTADRIALRLGFEKTSPKRLEAGILFALHNARDDGHCFLYRDQLQQSIIELLQIEHSHSYIIDELLQNRNSELFKVRVVGDVEQFYTPSIYHDEVFIAGWITEKKTLKVSHSKQATKEWMSWMGSIESSEFSLLSSEQKQALECVQAPFSILTGGPGVGKTTTTRAIVSLLQAMRKRVLLAAPTGRAAQRMSEVIGIEAKTIHRLLEFNPTTFGFNHNQENTLKADFIIIDETSMLDIHLTTAVLKAVSFKTQVLFIGDVDQLPSVGPGAILADCIASHSVPVFRLTEIFRQAAESLIIQTAHNINKGESVLLQTPFEHPEVWQNKTDCIFIDSEETTMEQQRVLTAIEKHGIALMKGEQSQFELPEKYAFADVQKILDATTKAQKLAYLSKYIPQSSSLRYGLTASEMVVKLYTETIEKYWGKHEVQVLVPMSRGSLGTIKLNALLQDSANPADIEKPEISLGDKVFRVGDRVIQKVNNYTLNVFNGDIGVILDVDEDEMIVEFTYGDVTYPRENMFELDLAYAITIHKSQGSEFPVVIMPLANQHFMMLQRNLVYTGLTRAKQLAIFVGNRRSLSYAISNTKQAKRQTYVTELLSK